MTAIAELQPRSLNGERLSRGSLGEGRRSIVAPVVTVPAVRIIPALVAFPALIAIAAIIAIVVQVGFDPPIHSGAAIDTTPTLIVAAPLFLVPALFHLIIGLL